jgi:hypothetical protein
MSRLRGHTKTKTKKLSAAAYCIYCDSTSGQVFFNTNALPRMNIGADVLGETRIMTGVY